MSYPKAIATLLFAGLLVLYHHLSGEQVVLSSIEEHQQMIEEVLQGVQGE